MKIQIIRNLKLIDGDQYCDKIEEIKTQKPISCSIITNYDIKRNVRKQIHVQLGNFLEKDFKEYVVEEGDMIYIEE